ncbi:alpha/beta fold hydrolase [Streptomyces sp. NBC_00083]|uniref:alpha/beta fold hydrolase n=1 Tax=Streptomyces sp. NBC_00083 TaxID=2975647 RepID=UPI0022550000|nr:alpha/beta fold hydrolase [Streptomyces sp. NBC_00083]MCX5388254.1 alpha/beta hydrolase [Streptomyces sp. NBC_00083]
MSRTHTPLPYADEGTGGALLLVHGHPFDRTMWAPQIEEFARTHRVIAPDLRGYGDAPVVPGTTLLADFAEDVLALADALGVERFTLGGLSMGGQIVMECYRLFPERIEGLLLADTFPAAETPEGRSAREATAERLVREGMAGYVDEALDRMVAPYAPESVRAHVRRMMTATHPEGAAAALRGRARRPDYRALLTTVSVPALVVVGRDDTYTPVADAEAMHAAIGGSELAVVEDAAHLPNLEQPAAFNEAVRGLLARVAARAKA